MFTEILTGITNREENLFSKKDLKKLVRFENRCYICTPQNTESSLIDWLGNERKTRMKIFKKNFKIYLPVKINFLLLHPL
jgi:hypothetical protein